MNKNIWTADAVVNAVMQGNPNLEIVISNYFKAFVLRLDDYNISIEGISSIDELNRKVEDGITDLETLRKEFISVVGIFASSNHPTLKKYLPVFFEDLLNHYEELDVNLYTGTSTDVLRNDHYRFFNQFLLISLVALLIENQCFDTLQSILHTKYKIYYKSYGMIREVNFIRFREYNYTLNQFLNTNTPKRISVTADYIRAFSSSSDFAKQIKADILLYYISLWQHTDDIFDAYWYPELSVYNRDKEILPKLISQTYFDKAKVLFGVNNIEEYKALLYGSKDVFERDGRFKVPVLQVGLLYDKVGSVE